MDMLCPTHRDMTTTFLIDGAAIPIIEEHQTNPRRNQSSVQDYLLCLIKLLSFSDVKVGKGSAADLGEGATRAVVPLIPLVFFKFGPHLRPTLPVDRSGQLEHADCSSDSVWSLCIFGFGRLYRHSGSILCSA